MKITYDWLKDYLQTNNTEKLLLSKLTDIGLEVENIEDSSIDLDKFLVAKIVTAEKHPNADRLKVCNVDIGNKKIVEVVCGASNAKDGLLTIYAPPGAIIPKNNMKLSVTKIRNITSYGMLCSESELNLSDESEGIIELEKNKYDKKVGKKYFDKVSSKLIDLSITPNRPDCLGVKGIARDLSAAGFGKLKADKNKNLKFKGDSKINVKILKEKNQGCLAFGSCLIKNVKNVESPNWLKDKLISVGQKPISAIVDVTNYIMLDSNRPLHAYDADKINKGIIVRNSKNGEKFKALNNKEYKLQEGMCVISDNSGVLGLGGIIGGTTTGTDFNTKNVLIESAYFTPRSIRKTSKILNIDTDAKFRFERGIDPLSIKKGLIMAAQLIKDICGGDINKIDIQNIYKFKDTNIIFEINSFHKIAGFKMSRKAIVKILNDLGFGVKGNKNQLKLKVPSWRPDITQEIDVVEELMRIYGYDKIKQIEPIKDRKKPTLNKKQKLFHFLQRAIASKGYREVITWSFTDSKINDLFKTDNKDIKIINPISADLNVLRNSIITNLIIHLNKNLNRDFKDLLLFEIGPVFHGSNPGEQETVIGGLRSGKIDRLSWIEKERNVDIFDVKKDVFQTLVEAGYDRSKFFVDNKAPNYYHPGKAGRVFLNKGKDKVAAYFGEIHPAIIKKMNIKTDSLMSFEIFLDNLKETKKTLKDQKTKYLISDFQKSERDFAFIIDKNFDTQALIDIILNTDRELIKDVNIFDVYEGEKIPNDKKSIALNINIQSMHKPLNETNLEKLNNLIIFNVEKKTGAKIRS
jgi:phenylalanyl-tRNA synthetase beta chain